MSKSIQLQIADPCHENWYNMTANEQGRFCQSCQKTVVDFTSISDKEIVEYFSNASTGLCGRFMNDQLNRRIRPEPKKKMSFAYLWNLLVATVLTTAYGNAQSGRLVAKTHYAIKNAKGASKEVEERTCHATVGMVVPEVMHLKTTVGDTIIMESPIMKGMAGSVVDGTNNNPVAGASIIIKGTNKGASADEVGEFNLEFDHINKPITIVVSAVGYTAQEYSIHKNSNGLITFYLKPSVTELGVVVVGQANLRRKVGLMSTITVISPMEKFQRTFDTWMNKKDVKLFPNPIAPGNLVNISLSLKEVGSYDLEILDVSGKVMYQQKINLESINQTIPVNTSSIWSAGIYWVRISNTSRKIYHAKMVLQ